jgi:hypothetical protein
VMRGYVSSAALLAREPLLRHGTRTYSARDTAKFTKMKTWKSNSDFRIKWALP